MLQNSKYGECRVYTVEDMETWSYDDWREKTAEWRLGDVLNILQYAGWDQKKRLALLQTDQFKGNDRWAEFMRPLLSLSNPAFGRMIIVLRRT